jgi:hypothetical protein
MVPSTPAMNYIPQASVSYHAVAAIASLHRLCIIIVVIVGATTAQLPMFSLSPVYIAPS